jgi:DNA processing protein
VIAGLCRAVIVVEAAVTGGALITATKAMEYGITVFAVPGDIDRDTSVP